MQRTTIYRLGWRIPFLRLTLPWLPSVVAGRVWWGHFSLKPMDSSPNDDSAPKTAPHTTAPIMAEIEETTEVFSMSIGPHDPPLNAQSSRQRLGIHEILDSETPKPEEQAKENNPKPGNTNDNQLTLQPFVPRNSTRTPSDRRRFQGNNRRRAVTERVLPGNQLTRPVPQDFRKFFLLKASDGGSLSRIDVIRANREIEKTLNGKPSKITETRTGTLIVEVKNELQSKNILSIKTLADVPVVTEEHAKLNESRGTIWYNNSYGYSEEELQKELSVFGVKSVYRNKKKQNNILIPTSIYVLTFDSCILPEKVCIGWTQCSVRIYIPRPRRCFKCQAFGHGANTCRREVGICANCAEEQHELPCDKPARCSNCDDAHPSSSNNCRAYKMEEEVLSTQVKERITYGEARRQVRTRYVRPRITFAEATRGQIDQTVDPTPIITNSTDNIGSTPHNISKKRAVEVSTQTDSTEETNVPSVPQVTSAAKPPDTASNTKSTCRPQPNATIMTIPSKKRPQSTTSTSPESPSRGITSKKPTLPTRWGETSTRRSSITETGQRPSITSTERRSSGTFPERRPDTSASGSRNDGGRREADKHQYKKPPEPRKENNQTSNLPKDRPLLPDITKMPPPPVVQMRSWGQSGRSHATK